MFAAALSPLLVRHLDLGFINLDKRIVNGQTIQGSYDFKSSALANTTNLALDNALFANFANPNITVSVSPVLYHL